MKGTSVTNRGLKKPKRRNPTQPKGGPGRARIQIVLAQVEHQESCSTVSADLLRPVRYWASPPSRRGTPTGCRQLEDQRRTFRKGETQLVTKVRGQ